jgi:hypothetical protein
MGTLASSVTEPIITWNTQCFAASRVSSAPPDNLVLCCGTRIRAPCRRVPSIASARHAPPRSPSGKPLASPRTLFRSGVRQLDESDAWDHITSDNHRHPDRPPVAPYIDNCGVANPQRA